MSLFTFGLSSVISISQFLVQTLRRVVTDTETELITQRKYNELVEQQKRVDAEVDAHLRKQEEDLRLEEEV